MYLGAVGGVGEDVVVGVCFLFCYADGAGSAVSYAASFFGACEVFCVS